LLHANAKALDENGGNFRLLATIRGCMAALPTDARLRLKRAPNAAGIGRHAGQHALRIS
jgi:hypothetical protein